MYDFFSTQMDYVYFLYGLAFILLGFTCLSGRRSDKTPIKWLWLGVFGIVHGTMEWLELLSITFGDSPGFHLIRDVITVISFMFLAEFGRSSLHRITGRVPGIYWIPVFLAVGPLGYFAGLPGFIAVSRYITAFGGGLLTAVSFFLFRKNQELKTWRWLTVASFMTAVYAVASGLIVPEAAFFPASMINTESFFRLTGIPIQLVRSLLAVTLAISVAVVKSRASADSDEKPFAEIRTKYIQQAAAILLLVISLGWVIAQIVEQDAARFNVILITLFSSVLLILLTLAWSKNKEAALQIAQLRIDAYANEQEQNLRNITSTLGEGVYVLDENGCLTYLNPAGEKILGWKQGDILGQNMHDIIHYEKADGTRQDYKNCPILRVIESGQACHSDDEFFIRRDGSRIAVSYISTPLIKDGKITGSVTAFHDITESKKAAEALRESEERYRMLFEKNTNPILVIDMEGNYIAGNKAALDFLEVSLPTLLTMNVKDTVPPGCEHILREHKPLWEHGGALETPYYVNGKVKTMELTINPVELSGRQVCFAMGKDITVRKEAEEKIKFMAYHDSLTNLPNRAMFKEKLKQAIDRAKREKYRFAILFLDFDRFKMINDTLGHSAGDEFLQVMATRLVSCVREEDTVSRQGGDEFTILLSRIRKPQDAVAVVKKILASVQKPVVLNGKEFRISASAGITIYPNDGEDIETLLRNADITMYRSKEAGGNIYRLYTPSMNVETRDRLEIEGNLRNALERQEFELHYQPLVNLKSGLIMGVEALLRWRHPHLGPVAPLEFIPIAEETGLIIPLGEWVLLRACSQAKKWQEAGHPDIRVAVNLSAHQFRQPELPRRIAKVLQETMLKPQYLELEITETTAMQNLDYSIKTISQLKEMGIRISLDDFGTGYSSLSYLKRFPAIDSLKIDRSFIEDISLHSEDKSAALVATMIILAQKLNLKVVAEGVETKEQLEFLRQYSCDEIQGFIFSQPLPPGELVQLLHRHCHQVPFDIYRCIC